MARCGRVFRHPRGSHRLHCQLASDGTSIFDISGVESGDRAASPEEIADLIAPAQIACAPWLTPIGASAAKDVLARKGLDTGPTRCAGSTPMPLVC
jgi:hypothetical protein